MTNIKSLAALALFACGTSMLAMEEVPGEFFSEQPLIACKTSTFELLHDVSTHNEYIANRWLHDDTVQLFSLRTGEPCNKQFKSSTGCAALSPCGKQLATINGRKVYLWNIQSGEHTAKFQNPGIDFESPLLFSPNSAHLALIVRNFWISIWSTKKPDAPPMRYKNVNGNEQAVFVDESTLAYAWYGETDVDLGYGLIERGDRSGVRLIDIRTGEQKAEMVCDASHIKYLTQAFDKPHIITAMTQSARCSYLSLWNTRQKPPTRYLRMTPDPDSMFDSIALAPRANYLIAGTDEHTHSLLLYKLNPERTAATLVWHMKLSAPYAVARLSWADNNSSIVHVNRISGTTLWDLSKEFQEKLALSKSDEETLDD